MLILLDLLIRCVLFVNVAMYLVGVSVLVVSLSITVCRLVDVFCDQLISFSAFQLSHV